MSTLPTSSTVDVAAHLARTDVAGTDALDVDAADILDRRVAGTDLDCNRPGNTVGLQVAGAGAEVQRIDVGDDRVARSGVDRQRQIGRQAHFQVDIGITRAEPVDVRIVVLLRRDADAVADALLRDGKVFQPFFFGSTGLAAHLDALEAGDAVDMRVAGAQHQLQALEAGRVDVEIAFGRELAVMRRQRDATAGEQDQSHHDSHRYFLPLKTVIGMQPR